MLRRLLAAALLWLVFAPAWGQPAAAGVVDVSHGDRYELSKAFLFLEDREGKLRIEDVAAPAMQGKFRSVPHAGPGDNFGLTSSAIWLKATLKAAPGAPRDWLLEIAYPPLDLLELYTPEGGGWREQTGGDLHPFAERAVPHRNHVLAVKLDPGRDTTIYLRIQSEGTVSAPATLWQPQALWQQDQQSYAALSLYFGLLGGLLLYNLLLFIAVRDIGYLIYVAFVAAMAVGQAALSGLGAQFLWTRLTWWNSVSPPIGLAAAAIFGIMFARNFLASRQRMPGVDRFIVVQMVGWGLAIAAAALLPYTVSSYMVTVLAVVSVATMVVAGIVTLKRDYPGARYFFTAWAVLLLGVATLALHNTGLLPSNAFTANALLIGSALEMVLLSFALADRINVARRFKEQAQARIAAEHAMVEVLRESQERLKTALEEREVILENSIVGICFLTRSGRLRWANKAMLQMFGAGNRTVTSMEPFYLSREQYLEVGGEVAAHAARGEVYQRELPVQQWDGKKIWILLSGKAVAPDDLDQGTVWVIMDITQRKELEEQLRRSEFEKGEALEQQKALNELRSRFVAMTSHEFRTPLAAIMSAEELLRHYGERLSPAERNEILDGIASGAQRMSRMIDRVLLIGKTDAGLFDFKPRKLELEPLCRHFIEEARAHLPDSGCTVDLRIDEGAREGRYDEKLLRHIFGNLLTNALKYSPGGGRVSFDVVREGDDAVFEVSDHGIGIPPDEVAHLFESFHRATNVGSIPGTGLGLAIVKNAVEKHGATITVRSELGRGTSFTVRFPQRVAHEVQPSEAVDAK